MFRPGDGVIRVGDATTHGGRVLTGQQNYIIHGKAVVVEGDLVSCPIKGHGVCPVINGHPTIFVNGKRVAFHGSHTGCGAQLITSDPLYALGDESTGLTGSIQRAPSPTRFQQPQQRNSFVDENEAPCDHPDQALDLSEYIVSEIQKNAVSDHVRKMKRWNSITAEDVEELWRKNMEGDDNLSLLQRIGKQMSRSMSRPNFHQSVSVARNSAAALWTNLVRQGGDWDHKAYFTSEEGTQKFATLGKSSYKFHHKYKEYEYYYDIWSNIHYGYIGAMSGFSRDTLLDGAGLEQIGSDLYSHKLPTDRSGVNGAGMRKYDDTTDNLSIRIGFQLLDKYPDPFDLTKEIVMNAVASAPYPIKNGSKIQHNCRLVKDRMATE